MISTITRSATRLAIVLSLACAALATTLLSATPAHASNDQIAEARFVDSINAERASRGLPRLRIANDLRDTARRHSATMASGNYLHHNATLTSDVDSWTRVAENVGRGPSVSLVHGTFMGSSAHRANILDSRVTEIGVGVSSSGSTLWVTQVFRLPAVERPLVFSDVSRSSSHARDIDRLAATAITVGCGVDTYCPGRQVTRAEMATFLARSNALLPRDPRTFDDTGGRSAIHAANIEAIAKAGLTNGCGSGAYCPRRSVTRAEMASFLARSAGLTIRQSDTRYADVDPNSSHAGAIEAIARAGITNGCGGDRYCPERPVTRQEMASFLVRTFGL